VKTVQSLKTGWAFKVFQGAPCSLQMLTDFATELLK